MSDKVSMLERMAIAYSPSGAPTSKTMRRMRRVLQEMRTPTGDVLQAGSDCVPPTEEEITLKDAALEIWQAMIDEAFKS